MMVVVMVVMTVHSQNPLPTLETISQSRRDPVWEPEGRKACVV
jgi:hypothetical protein